MPNETGADLASSARKSAGFPWGGTWGSLTDHSPLQAATLLSQHYYYLRWPNLHVRRSVTFYIKFISACYHACVTGHSCCSTVHAVNLLVKVQYIWKYGGIQPRLVYIFNHAWYLTKVFWVFSRELTDQFTAICIQAQTANIFARLFTFETGRLPLETEMFHCSCDALQCKA